MSLRAHPALKLFCVLSLVFLSSNYSLKLTMGAQTSQSISNYNQDMFLCSCDLSTTLCDNFCCCDTLCSSASVAAWTDGQLCKGSSSGMERYCSQLSSGGFASFEDLACVYFSNRGTIGNYYVYPSLLNLNYPTPALFTSQWVASKTITQNIGAASATTLYTSTSRSLKATYAGAVVNFIVLRPGAGGNCDSGTVSINASKTYSCTFPIDADNCASANTRNAGTFAICLNGNCSSVSASFMIPSSTVSEPFCNSVVTGYSIAFTLGSSGSEYIVSAFTMIATTSNVRLGSMPTVTTTIKVTVPGSGSGNPGQSLGSQITMLSGGSVFTILSIGDSSNNCYTTANNAAAIPLSILFGQNIALSCIRPSASCPSSLYVDSLAKTASLSLLKYGISTLTNQTISVQGLGTTVDTCSKETLVFNILYSDVGWELNKQSYIIGASLTTMASPESTFRNKFLVVRWKYVSPSEVSAPASNTFYKYFKYLSTPLKEKFGIQ